MNNLVQRLAHDGVKRGDHPLRTHGHFHGRLRRLMKKVKAHSVTAWIGASAPA